MSNKEAFLGQLFTGLLFLLIACGVYAFYIDFVPSEATFRYGLIASIIMSICCLPLCIPAALLKFDSLVRRIVGVVCSTLLLGAFMWVTFCYSLAALYTNAMGIEHDVVVTVDKNASTSRRGCTYQITSSLFEGALPSYFCIDARSYRDPSRQFQLVGKQSTLGVIYNEIYLVR